MNNRLIITVFFSVFLGLFIFISPVFSATAGSGLRYDTSNLCRLSIFGCPEETNIEENNSGQGSANQSSTQRRGLLATIFNIGPKPGTPDPVITVVIEEGTGRVFRIVSGLKHEIPSSEIFYSYGYSTDILNEMSSQELGVYPRAKLFMLVGDESQTVYYLTEQSKIRPILNDAVFYSYGNRAEDIIFINAKEFNFYPRIQFVYVAQPEINQAVFQISGGTKRYVTPTAVERLEILEEDVAPINQTEFDAYPTGEPIIF